MTTKTISKEILDNIVEQLCEGSTDWNCKSYANYDENGIYIDACVRWQYEESENWITIDGVSYLEGTYDVITGFDELSVDAWVGDEKVDIYDYIEQNLYY
jgi:hypothetical protein